MGNFFVLLDTFFLLLSENGEDRICWVGLSNKVVAN